MCAKVCVPNASRQERLGHTTGASSCSTGGCKFQTYEFCGDVQLLAAANYSHTNGASCCNYRWLHPIDIRMVRRSCNYCCCNYELRMVRIAASNGGCKLQTHESCDNLFLILGQLSRVLVALTSCTCACTECVPQCVQY